MRIDAHTHVQCGDEIDYPLRPDLGHWFHGAGEVDSLVASLDGAGVDAAVVVQFVGAYAFDCRCAVDAVTAHADRLALVGAVDLDGPDPAGDLRHLAATTPARAVRVFGVGASGAAWLHDGRAAAVWAAAADAGIGIVATLWADDLAMLATVVAANPAVPVALDHCGFVDLAGDLSALLALAELAPIHLKVSSQVLAPAPDPAPVVARLAGAFGSSRLAWGSDFPQTDRPYEELVALGERAVGDLDPAARADVLGGTAHRLWFTA